MKQQMLEQEIIELKEEIENLRRQVTTLQLLMEKKLNDERSGKAWRDANGSRSMEREKGLIQYDALVENYLGSI